MSSFDASAGGGAPATPVVSAPGDVAPAGFVAETGEEDFAAAEVSWDGEAEESAIPASFATGAALCAASDFDDGADRMSCPCIEDSADGAPSSS